MRVCPYRALCRVLDENWVQSIGAVARLTSGAPNQHLYVPVIGGPSALAELTDRVVLEFADHNQSVFLPADAVALHVRVKNCLRLTVKVTDIGGRE